MNLTPEQILENWNRFLSVIDQYIESPRKEQLLEFYQKYEERFSLMPASHKSGYHNSFPGGYIDHVLRVIDASLELDKVWRKFDCKRELGHKYTLRRVQNKIGFDYSFQPVCNNCGDIRHYCQPDNKYEFKCKVK